MSASRDLLVVGAGVIGCAVAFELARRGASVQLIDDRAPGFGATHASAGVLAPFIEAREDGPLLELAVRSLELFDDYVARAQADSGLPVVYGRSGSLDVAFEAYRTTRLQAAATALSRRGVAAEFLDADAARRAEPHLTDRVCGGLLVACHGYVSAMDLTRALAAAARRQGARLIEQGRVTRIAESRGDLIVDTEDGGSLRGGGVVLAAGSWAAQVAIAGVSTPVPVRPVRGQLLHLAWQGTRLKRVTWGDRCYLVPWDDGTLLVGATVEEAGFDERATADGVHELIASACELVPHARSAGFVAARAGLRPGTPDDLPVIGPSRVLPNLVYATGHYRNGILLSPLTAQLVADMLLDGRRDALLGLTDPTRFGNL